LPLYLYDARRFQRLEHTSFGTLGILERFDLQAALKDQIDVICPDCLVISEEFSEWDDSRRRIDLLAVDKSANLVVIELKRDDTGQHMDLQAIRYAAMVSTLTFKRAVEIYRDYNAKHGVNEDAEQKLLGFLGWEESKADAFAREVHITLVATDFLPELTTTVLWLNDRHDFDIRCVRLVPYKHNQDVLVDVEQAIPLPEAESYQVRIRQQSAERREARQSDRDYTRYLFKGTIYNKRKLVLAVIKDWLKANHPTTIEELLEAFPQETRRGGLFVPIEEAQETFERQQIARHFLADEEVIDLGAGKTYAVSNQWGGRNMERFLERAHTLQFDINISPSD
jgi:hypothetical protein